MTPDSNIESDKKKWATTRGTQTRDNRIAYTFPTNTPTYIHMRTNAYQYKAPPSLSDANALSRRDFPASAHVDKAISLPRGKKGVAP